MQSIQVYYDLYEFENGDGFFPQVEYRENYHTVILNFRKVNDEFWVQTNDPVISGLDGSYGQELLEVLNSRASANCNGILNTFKRQIFIRSDEIPTEIQYRG